MDSEQRRRTTGAIAAIALHLLVGALLLVDWRAPSAATEGGALAVFDIVPPRLPPPPPPPAAARTDAPRNAAAPPNLVQEPSAIVAPVPIVTLPPLAPIVTAPVAGPGAAPDAGAAAVAGPGTSAGGEGDGTGGGGTGGDGAGDEGYVPPRQIRGRLRSADFVRTPEEEGTSRRVGVRYLVETDGRVTECEVTRPSGNAALDANTCRLIIERFRFRPSRDPQGRPVASYVVENHGWYVEHPGPERRP